MSMTAKPVPFGPDLRSALIAMVRKRVPDSEVEDIVQQALAEAIESPHAPQESEALRRWIFGVAKNKVVDYHRRAGRESFELPDVAGTPAPHVEADLLRWAEKNLPDGAENQKTLDWMLREGEGEKLESIAESEKLPPPRVRQRVSRLRRHFKENWQREVALLAALGVIVSAVVFFILKKQEPEPITHEMADPRAEPVRRAALEKCAKSDFKSCIDGLDEARRLDPAGDSRPDVQQARKAADDALKATPSPSPSDSPSPSPAPTTQPPSPAPSSSFSPMPDESAPMQQQKAAPKAPTKPQSTELSPTPPAPTPTPSAFFPPPTKADSKEAATPPSKVAAPPAAKPQRPAGKAPAQSSDFSGGFGGSGGSKKK